MAGQVHALPETLKEYSDFVIKPAHGSGGEGILVIVGRLNGKLRKHDGLIITWEDLYPHIFNVLSGLYSLGVNLTKRWSIPGKSAVGVRKGDQLSGRP